MTAQLQMVPTTRDNARAALLLFIGEAEPFGQGRR